MSGGKVELFQAEIRLRDYASAALQNARNEIKKFTMDGGISMSGLGQAFKLSGLAMAGAAGVAVTGLAALAKTVADQGEQFLGFSQRAGMSVEAISQLTYAAGNANISTEQFQGSMEALAKNSAMAASGNAKAAQGFLALGVSVRDSSGQIKTNERLLAEISDRFSQTADGAGKTAAAAKIFGDSGAALIPMLNGGAEGLAKMRAEADSLGQTWTQTSAESAARFNDELNKMKGAASGMAISLGQQLIPAFTELAAAINQAAQQGDGWVSYFKQAAEGAVMFATAVMGGKKPIGELAEERVRLSKEVADLEERERLVRQGVTREWGDSLGQVRHELKKKQEELIRTDIAIRKHTAAVQDAANKERDAASNPSPKKPSITLPSSSPKKPGSGGVTDDEAWNGPGGWNQRFAAAKKAADDEIAENQRVTEEWMKDLERRKAARDRALLDEAEMIAQAAEYRLQLGLGSEAEAEAAKKNASDIRRQQELADVDLTESQKAALKEKWRAQDMLAEQQAAQQKLQYAMSFFNTVGNLVSTMAQAAQQRAQQDAANLRKEYDQDVQSVRDKFAEEQKAQEKALEDKEISREQYDQWKQSADDRRAEWEKSREEKLNADKQAISKGAALKAFKMQQGLSMAQAAISTAQAVAAALAGPPGPPWSIPLAIAAGASGAAQIALIQSQKPPEFAQGGVVTRDTLARVGEAGPEAIVPLSGGRNVPVELRGGGGPREVVIELAIHNVVGGGGASPSPDAIVNVIDQNIASNGVLRKTIRKALG